MSAVEQFTYTASPWGRSTPGWMTFQKSPGIEDSEIGEISSYYRYGRPDGWDGAPEADMLSSYPVQFVFARPQSFGGDALLVQTTFTGERWYDPRPGDWFAHGLRIPSAMLSEMASSGMSVFRCFLSQLLDREYPKKLRDKAEKISKRKIPWENPPDLPALDSFDERKLNKEFDLEVVLGRMPDGAWPKLGSMLSACVGRAAGAKALVFDATKPESLDTMAALLALMPQRLRMEAQFATYFHAENVREVKSDDTFLFYGIVREGELADPDTGLYGELLHGGPEFTSREDVELFKKMVDACGDRLGAGDFDSLVKCWDVASGRDCSVKAMQTANAFCVGDDGGKPRYVALQALLLKKIAEQLSNDVNTNDAEWVNRFVVTRFKINAVPDDYALNQFCEACTMDREMFNIAFQCLKDDTTTLRSFLKELEHAAGDKELKQNLAERLFEADMDAVVDVKAMEDELPFINLVLRYHEIVKRGAEKSSDPSGDIEVLEALQEKVGKDIPGMEDVLSMLRYENALSRVKTIEDIPIFLEPPFPEKVSSRMKDDLVSRIKPSSPHEKIRLACAFDKVGISGNDYIEMEWLEDLAHNKELQQANEELTRRPTIFSVACIGILCVLIGWAGHWLFGCSRQRANQTIDIWLNGEVTSSLDTSQRNATSHTPDLPVLEQTKEVHALASKEGTQLVAGGVAANTTERERDSVVQKPQAVQKKISYPGTEIKTDKKSSSAPKDAGVK